MGTKEATETIYDGALVQRGYLQLKDMFRQKMVPVHSISFAMGLHLSCGTA